MFPSFDYTPAERQRTEVTMTHRAPISAPVLTRAQKQPARAERRRFPRHLVLVDLEYAYPANTAFIPGLVYNCSRGGVLMGSDFPFTPGERVRIRLSRPRTLLSRKADILVTGQICWTVLRTPAGCLPVHEAGVLFSRYIDLKRAPGLRTLLPCTK